MVTYPLTPETLDSLQKFQTRLNSQPSELAIESTPDRKAQTVVISHIEMTLDELFLANGKPKISNGMQLPMRCKEVSSSFAFTR